MKVAKATNVEINKIERKVEVIRKVNRPIKVVKYDDYMIKKLEKKIRKYQKSYVPPADNDEVEIIEEEGDIVEKIVEVPVKQVKKVNRNIDKIHWDNKKINNLKDDLQDKQNEADDLNNKIQSLIEKRNVVREQIEEVKVEIKKFVPRNVEVVKYQKSATDQLERELSEVKKNLEIVIEEYRNLKKADREYKIKTVEVPYETIKYVGVEHVVNKVDNTKVNKLELKLQRLKEMEEEINEHRHTIDTNKNTPIEKVKTVPKEVITYIDRPIRTLKLKDDKVQELEMQLREAQGELSSWKAQCDEYDIVRERIVEVPVEKIVEVDYEVEVRKVDDKLVNTLAQSVCDIKNNLYELESVHDNLIEKKGQTFEKIVEVPKNVVKYVDREINVVRFDPEKINEMQQQIKTLKSGLSRGRKDFSKYEQMRNTVEKRVEVEQEVVKFIDRPIEYTSFSRSLMKDINSKLNAAYSAMTQYQDKYRLLKEDKYTAQEKIVEVETEKKKFAIKKKEIHRANDDDVQQLESQIKNMELNISEFRDKVSTVQKNLKKKVIKETKVEVPKEKLVYVEVPTEIMTIDHRAQRDIKNELKKLKTATTSALKAKMN